MRPNPTRPWRTALPLDLDALRGRIEQLFSEPPAAYAAEHRELFASFKDALNRGEIRAASPDVTSPTGWRVNPWVKQGILVGFRMGEIVDMSVGGLAFLDKSTYPP